MSNLWEKLISKFKKEADKERGTPRHTLRYTVIGDMVTVKLAASIYNRPSMKGVPLDLKGMVLRVEPDFNLKLMYMTEAGSTREIVILIDEILDLQILKENK